MISPDTRLVLRRHPKYEATVDVVVQHTGQSVGWLRVGEVATLLQTLGCKVFVPKDLR